MNHNPRNSDIRTSHNSLVFGLERLEERLLLSIAIGNVIANSPLARVLEVAMMNVENALPPAVREVTMPLVHALMGAHQSAMIYQAMPGETNQVQVWGELANALLMLNETKDISVARALTFSFDPIEKMGVGLLGKMHAGASFVGEICAGLGVKADGLEEFLWKQLISPAEVRVIGVNQFALLNLFPALGDFVAAFDSFLDFSLSDLFPDEVTIIPPVRLFGKTIWDGLTIQVPDWLQDLPTVRDLVGNLMPTPLRDVVNVIGGVLYLLTAEFRLDGIYISTLDGNDSIDLSRLTGIPETVHGDLGNDKIIAGGGGDLLASWGVPFRGNRDDAPISLYGDSGDDTFVINQFFDSKNTTIDGGPGEDRLVIEGTDANDIIRLIAGPDGKLAEIRFERANPSIGSPVNEKQRITLPSDVVDGNFIIKAEGWPDTAEIYYNASAAAVQTALVTAARTVDPTIGPEDLQVYANGRSWDIEFQRKLGAKNFRNMVVDGSKLVRRLTPAAVQTEREGGNGNGTAIANEVQQIDLNGATGGTFTLQFSTYGPTDAISYHAGPRDIEFALLQAGMSQDDFDVTGPYGGPWQIEFTGTLAKTNVSAIVVDGSDLTGALADWNLTRIQAGTEQVNEVQVFRVPSEAGGGTYTLTFQAGGASRTTAPIPFDAVAAEIGDALGALGTIGGRGNVDVTLQADGSFRVEFIGGLAGADQPLLQVNAGGLAGIAVATLADGGGGANERQQIALTETPQGGQFRLSFGSQTTAPINTAANAAGVQAALEALSTIGAGNVLVSGPAGGPWVAEFIGALADTDVAQLTAGFAVDVQEAVAGSGGANEVQRLVIPAAANGGQLRLAVHTPLGTNAAYVAPDADAATIQDALEALTCVGEGNVSVTGGGGTFEITFQGDLAATPIDPVLADTRYLSGGATPVVQENSSTVVNEIQNVTIPYPDVTTATFKLRVPGYSATADISVGATPATVQSALAAVVGAGNVQVTGEPKEWRVEFTDTLGGKNVEEMLVEGGKADTKGGDVLVEEVTPGSSGEDTLIVATTRFAALKDVESLIIKGSTGDDTLIVDDSLGPIAMPGKIVFEGNEGLNRVVLRGDDNKPAELSEYEINHIATTFGTATAARTQSLSYFGSYAYDLVPAKELRVLGSAAGEEIEIGAGQYEGAAVGQVSVSGGATPADYGDGGRFEVNYLNKQLLTLFAGGGDDQITLDASGLTPGMTQVVVDVGSSTEGDKVLIVGSDQVDVFDYMPTSLKGGVLLLDTGGRIVSIDLAGVESFCLDGADHGAAGDTLIIRAASAAVVPGDFPGAGEVTAVGASGASRLEVTYVNIEHVDVRSMNVLTFDGSLGDDVVEVTATQLIFYDFFGHANVTDVTGASIVYLCLMDGNDELEVDAAGGLPFQLEVWGGGGDAGGDVVRFIGTGDRVALDLDDQSLVEAGASHVTFFGIESFTIETAGGPLAVHASEDDDTLQVTALDSDSGRLSLNGSTLTVRYVGVAGLPVALDLAGGQDVLVVNGSATSDTAVLDADSFTFTDDGRALAYAGVEALTFNGLQGHDRLDVDNSAGLIALPGGVFFDGGAGRDLLRLLGTAQVDLVTYEVGPGAGAGTVIHRLDDIEQVVSFANLEPVIDLVQGPLVVNGTTASDTINYDAGPNSGSPLIGGLDTMQVSVNGFEALEFGAKSALTVNGLAGDDAIDLSNAVNPPELAAITLDGGAGNDTLIGSAGNDVLIGGRGNDVLMGQDSDDTLVPGLGQDELNGGPGDDVAVFSGTAGADTASIRAGKVAVNDNVGSLVNVERVTLDMVGGNDEVSVEADTGFPDRVDVAGGAGDDNIVVLLHNPAPATTIAIDGGPHVAGDEAVVKGMTGDDQFAAYGSVNVFGAAVVFVTGVEDNAVLEGRRIDTDPATLESGRFTFPDADGNAAAVQIRGPGAVDVFRNIIGGRSTDIAFLELIGTDEGRTAISVEVRRRRGTDNETAIGAITGSGAAVISAPCSDLVGAGLNLSGGVGSLVLDDIRDGADVLTGGTSGQPLHVRADEVGVVELRTAQRIAGLHVSSWLGGAIRGSSLDSIVAAKGPFRADLVNSRQDRLGYGVGDVWVRGDLDTHITADRVRSVRVLRGNAVVQMTVTSDAATLAGEPAIGSFRVIGGNLLGGRFDIQPNTLLGSVEVRPLDGAGGDVIGSMNVAGDLGDVFIGGNLLTSGWLTAGSIRQFTVRGLVSASGATAAIRAGADIGAIALGGISHVDVLAGINAGAARRPADSGDFATPAHIGTISIKGWRVPRGQVVPRFVTDSNFSAASMGQVRLVNASPASAALFVLGANGSELASVRHIDTVDPAMSFYYPPKRHGVFNPPFPLVNIL